MLILSDTDVAIVEPKFLILLYQLCINVQCHSHSILMCIKWKRILFTYQQVRLVIWLPLIEEAQAFSFKIPSLQQFEGGKKRGNKYGCNSCCSITVEEMQHRWKMMRAFFNSWTSQESKNTHMHRRSHRRRVHKCKTRANIHLRTCCLMFFLSNAKDDQFEKQMESFFTMKNVHGHN